MAGVVPATSILPQQQLEAFVTVASFLVSGIHDGSGKLITAQSLFESLTFLMSMQCHRFLSFLSCSMMLHIPRCSLFVLGDRWIHQPRSNRCLGSYLYKGQICVTCPSSFVYMELNIQCTKPPKGQELFRLHHLSSFFSHHSSC